MGKEIGGFFELELKKDSEYHKNAIKLNSARYCIQYLIRAKGYKKIYLPHYIGSSVLQPIVEENIEYEYYSIDSAFKPLLKADLGSEEVILYVNYFGLNSNNIKYVLKRYDNVIVDNTQAFFEKGSQEFDSVYSPRKFFGVPDGGYLYTDKKFNIELEEDISFNRFEHLLKRIDMDANNSYSLFKKNEETLDNSHMKKMSKATMSILSSIDYEECKKIRNNNFKYLHSYLEKYNKISLDVSNLNGPMIYPFVVEKSGLKDYLIKNKIYVATYWKEVLERVEKNSFEYLLAKYLIPLPIDQRYSESDMKLIIDIINEFNY
ncbi:hypothetical protein [Clostridium sp. YIM B02506]|uniref:hypothetical protein n=1 Tax=Clostridium sp. YIM B02506 TaxID=2910680 RepID=UPI001EEF2D52|nr:hypothetical protein [Clostridium sp. YIM B02506]